MSTEYERPDVKSKILKPRTSVVENFYRFLMRENGNSYTLKRIEFDVQNESVDPDGTKHITIYPFRTEEVVDFKPKGFYLISSDDNHRAYLLEFSEPSTYGDHEYFVGINSVRNPKSVENKNDWAREVLKNRVSHIFNNQSWEVLSSIGILQRGGEDLAIQLYGHDRNLINFFESLK